MIIVAFVKIVKTAGAVAKPTLIGFQAAKQSLGALLFSTAATLTRVAVSGMLMGAAMGGFGAWAHGGDI